MLRRTKVGKSMSYPKEGETIQIHSYKHNGQMHRIWDKTKVLKGTHDTIIGANDRTIVTESDGRTWLTREPAICYFHARHWFNVIGMLRNDGVYFYCNISSPFAYDHEALKYIDYDLDIKVSPDMTYMLLDEDEYERHRREMNYPDVIHHHILKKNVKELTEWIEERKGPFAPDFVDRWYDKYLTQYKR